MKNSKRKIRGSKLRLCMYIKILYNRAAYTLYIKAYIKYKNKDKRWCFTFLSMDRLLTAFSNKWQYRRPRWNIQDPECNRARWKKPTSPTWNGHGYKCWGLFFVFFVSTRHIICMQQRGSMDLAVCTDTRCCRVVLFRVNMFQTILIVL